MIGLGPTSKAKIDRGSLHRGRERAVHVGRGGDRIERPIVGKRHRACPNDDQRVTAPARGWIGELIGTRAHKPVPGVIYRLLEIGIDGMACAK